MHVSLLLLKIEHSFQESIDNNKSIGIIIYRCQIQANIKKRKTFEVFKLIYFIKPPIKKVLIKLMVLSDASILFKVLIELSPGACVLIKLNQNKFNKPYVYIIDIIQKFQPLMVI